MIRRHLACAILVMHSICVGALPPVVVGAEREADLLPLLTGKRLGLIVNQSALSHGRHLVDYLRAADMDIRIIFSPEHGFRGDHDAGAVVKDGVDPATGITISSLYGAQRRPPAASLAQLDLLVFDIQDVGVRFYTYISTLHEVMESCADTATPLLVLDRPNPHGASVDGPMLHPAYRSFVGRDTLPLLHGLTVAELATMIRGEGWLDSRRDCALTVLPMRHYYHRRSYSLPVPPSPNLPNDQAVQLYPSLALFEATPISIGRGTDFPFQLIAYRYRDGSDFSVTPRSIPGTNSSPKLLGVKLWGEDLRDTAANGLDLSYLLRWAVKMRAWGEPLFDRPAYFDKLAGSDELRRQIESGMDEAGIRASWQDELQTYREIRKQYLLYREE